ncbi:MAG: DUF5057 domain-containing protein [Lachnospiraceae bacterium]|nr:DUF5057 domain-containing protein [Lachnospiraceae bacterium]
MRRIMRNGKKLNGKRIAAAAVAGLSAAAVVMTAVLSDVIEAEAADTLIGIEKLRTRYKESGSEYVILEIVPDRSAAEIGYLVGGYEPILCEWDEEEMAWESWQNTLCALPATRRKGFIEDKKQELRDYYAKQGLTKNFPVEAVEAEYEEGEPKEAGFEKIVSDGVKKTGWFQKIDGDTADESDRYQVVFNYNGKYDEDNFEIDPENVLYYTVLSATKIDANLAGGIEADRPIYVKRDEGVYECVGTWDEVSSMAIAAISDGSTDEEEEEDQDESGSDNGKNEDDNNGDDNGGDGNNKNDGGTDNSDGGDNGDDSGDDGDNDDDSGNGDGSDNGDDSGNGDGGDNNDDSGNGDGGDNSGDSGNDGGNSGGDTDNGDNSDSGNGNNDNSSGSESDNNNGSTDNGGSADSASVKRTVSAATALQQGKWFKSVSDDIPSAGFDDGATADDTQESRDDAAADDKTDPADSADSGKSDSEGNTGADDKTDSDDGADSDDKSDSNDNTDTDQTDSDDSTDNSDPDDETDSDQDSDADTPAADDPNDEEDEESVREALAQESTEYYLVAFVKVTDYGQLSTDIPIYSCVLSKNIVLSEDGEYEFVEWNGVDESQTRQVYTFPGREIWCKNTFKSNEWFKKYVLNMDKADYGEFRIKVLTYTPQELNKMEQIPNFNFLYLNSGLRVDVPDQGDKPDSSGNESGDDSGSDDKTGIGEDSENIGNDEDSGNDGVVSADAGSDIMTKVLAADSLQGKWRKLVANDNLETATGGSVSDSGSENNSDTGVSSGSEAADGSENNSSTGDDNGSVSDSGSGDKNESEPADGSGDNDGTGNDDGSVSDSSSENSGDKENNDDADNTDDSEIGSDSEDNKDADNTDGSETDKDSEDDKDIEKPGDSKKPGNSKSVKAVSDSISGNDIGDTGSVTYSEENDLSDDLLEFFFDKTIAGAMPCLVDGAILYVKNESGSIDVNEELKDTNIFRLSAMLCQDNLSEWYEKHRNNYVKLTVKQLMDGIVDDADKNFVTEQVYCRFGSDSIINSQFAEATIYKEGKEIEPGFQCVLDEIELENLYREADTSGNYKPLSTNISQAKAVRHILNYRDRRKVETKKDIRVLEIQPAMADTPELTLDQLKEWAPGVEAADITVMTTAEFIGKIEKLNETYDLIYIGTSKDHLNMRYWMDRNYTGKPDKNHIPSGTAFNDADMDGLIYCNIGDLRVTYMPLAGQLDTEYWNNDRNENVYYYNYMRYGGNDITEEKEKALLSFLDGSYPVIIADDFIEQPATIYEDIEYRASRVNLAEGEYTQKDLQALGVPARAISSLKVKKGYRVTVFDQDNFQGNSAVFTKDEINFVTTASQGNWNDRVVSLIIEREENAEPSRRIDEDHIDNCTYLYEFVKKALDDKYVNFYTWGDIGEDSELFKFYLNRPKVSLTETAVGGEVKEGSDIYYINSDMNGRYSLNYRFKIQNEGTASYNTKYRCKLYIDVNSDGKFSAQEEIEDISITQNGGSVSADALYADRSYILSRQVPMGYKGLLPWRLEITQADNPNIYTSMSGFTKLEGMEQEQIKVLQIGRDVIKDVDWWGREWERLFDLGEEIRTPGTIYNTLVYGGTIDGVYYEGISKEFDIDVTFKTIPEYEQEYAANPEYLKNFNMLILGFSDSYGDFTGDAETGAMGAIIDFVNSGKSVLFAHDTTSYFNYEKKGGGYPNFNGVGYPWRDNHGDTRSHDQYHWASTLNTYFRNLVGMDRFGILSTGNGTLQRGDVLREGTEAFKEVVESRYDVAYKPKSGKKETVPQVHGYTYQLINAKDLAADGGQQKIDYNRWELDMSKPNDWTFSNTYRNIRYDKVYYAGGASENDRYGEVVSPYNGEIDQLYVNQVNRGQIVEYPYKLSERFEVAMTHGQYYELDYTADDDGDGQSDLVVWYCLGSRGENGAETIYSQSPNDVRNNYYIYNKGNITYTGMGHSASQNLRYTVEEAKLFINTMIASYQAGIKDPQISVLKSGVPESDSMKLLYRYYDSGNNFSLNDEAAADAYEKIYFTVQDINFIKGTRKIESHVYYKDDAGGEVINVDGEDITVSRLPDNMCSAKDGSAVDAYNLTSGGIYYIQVPRDIMKKCEDGLDLYFEAQSTITTNTAKANVYTTEKVYAKLQVLQAYLFNLE